jgi:hypothetical protein
MKIIYQPQNPAARRAHTNLGEFRPGEVRELRTDREQKEGRRLVANGDFVFESTAAVADPASDALKEAVRKLTQREDEPGTTAEAGSGLKLEPGSYVQELVGSPAAGTIADPTAYEAAKETGTIGEIGPVEPPAQAPVVAEPAPKPKKPKKPKKAAKRD